MFAVFVLFDEHDMFTWEATTLSQFVGLHEHVCITIFMCAIKT